MSVSTCGGLIHGGAYIRGGGAYSRRFTVDPLIVLSVSCMNINDLSFNNTFTVDVI